MSLLLTSLFSFIIGVSVMYVAAREFGDVLGFGGGQTDTSPSEVQPHTPGPDNRITTMPPLEELRQSKPHSTESQDTEQSGGG